LDDFASGASLYRRARKAGITIRSSIDCLIAATCIRNDAPILHADEDFDRLASCTSLEIFA
jgi:predicted nucleic acid-binding protein